MRARRILLNLVAVAATVLLAGCYVTTQKLPASTGPVMDAQLIGTWRAIDEDGKPDATTFLSFVKADDNKPLAMVMVDDHSWTVYEVSSLEVGKRHMFAAKQTLVMRDKPDHNFIIGFYEVKGDMLEFNLLDPTKIKEAITAHQIKGRVEPGASGKVVLTASPAELAKFFADTDMTKLTGDKPAKAQRISTSK